MAVLWCEARCGAIGTDEWDEGCLQTSEGAFGAVAASKNARAHGWRVISGDWVCPVCARAKKEGKQ